MFSRQNLMIALAVLSCILAGPRLGAQETSGSVSGQVADQTGASVPEARIDLINKDTGSTNHQSSNSEGQFVFNLVPPGLYSIKATKEGFQTFTLTGLTVEVNRVSHITVTMQLGATTQSIEVTANAATVDVTSAQVATNVEAQYVTELPTSNGRSVLMNLQLAPGVQVTGFLSSQVIDIEGSYARTGGSRTDQNVWSLDGSENIGDFRGAALQFPNPEAVQEVEATTSNSSAEFGKQPGGVFNVITKSGTNQLHGSAFYFFHLTGLDANTWSQNKSGVSRTQDTLRQGGGTLGGPLRKNRTFFFASYQIYNSATPGFQNTHKFLTPAMENGDFSQFSRPLYDPNSGVPLPNNQIPKSLMDPVVANLLPLLPTVANYGAMYVWRYDDPTKNNEVLAKIDHTLNSAHQLQFSYYRTWGDQTLNATAAGENAPAFGPQLNTSHQNTLSARHTWTLSPTLVMQNSYALAQHDSDRGDVQLGRNLSSFGAIWPDSGAGARKYLPELVLSDGFSTNQGYLSLFKQHNYRFTTTLNWMRGAHNLKFGGEAQRLAIRQKNDQDAATFSFTGQAASQPATGLPVGIGVFGYGAADFLMGRCASFSLQGLRDYDIHDWGTYFFAQDEWRMSRKLTLTAGLRYEFATPATELNNKISGFVFGHQSNLYASAPVGVAFAGDSGVPFGLYQTNWNAFAPRLGLAYDPFGDGKTAVRAGAGYYFSHLPMQDKMTMAEQTPWSPTASGGNTLNMVNPWGTSRTVIYSAPPTPFSSNVANYNYPSAFSMSGFSPDFRTPYVLEWNLSLQRQVRKGITLQAAYVGNRGKKLFQSVQMDAAPWTPAATPNNVQQRRPYQGYTGITMDETRSLSWYDSLQLTADVKPSANLSLRFMYVYAKLLGVTDADPSLGTTSSANPLCLNCEKASIIPQQQVTVYYVYRLPFLRDAKRLTSKVLGNWQVSGIVSATAGSPLNVTIGQDWNYDGVSGDRPNLVAPIVYTSGSAAVRSAGYFSANSFATPPTHNAFGSLGRYAVVGPGQWDADFALFKNFYITEKRYFQFRAETFDLFNHPNLGNPDTTMSDAAFTQILTRSGNRMMQLGLRFLF